MPENEMDFLFNPGSIAVVGASEDEGKLASVILKNLKDIDFSGKLYAVNQ